MGGASAGPSAARLQAAPERRGIWEVVRLEQTAGGVTCGCHGDIDLIRRSDGILLNTFTQVLQ